MSKPKDIKITAGNQYYGGSSIAADVRRINQGGNLADELGIFRLASVHRDLDLANQPPQNAVLVNLRIKFITKADVEVEHVIPVMVTQGDGQEALTYYSGSEVEEKEFLKFYNDAGKKTYQLTNEPSGVFRQGRELTKKELFYMSCYHSEPFLAYYLCSDDGKNFLRREFKEKGLIAFSGDGKTYESNVKEVVSIGMDLHSTKVVCFNCGPFLKAATPKLLESINGALVLPKDKRPKAIKYNVSANQFGDDDKKKYWNMRSTLADHIPVMEGDDRNIITNTEKLLGESTVRLQKVGESSNRTYFFSGSLPVNIDLSDVIALRGLDEKRWQIVTASAAVEIQRMWRGFRDKKKLELKKSELREVGDEIDEKDDEAENLRKEIDALKERLEVVSEINDLAQRIENGEIDGEEQFDEIENLYERAIENDLFEEAENSSYDSNSKFGFLLELQGSEKSLEKQKALAKSDLDDLEDELENLKLVQEMLEQQIKDLSSVAPSKKSSGTKVAKKSTQKTSAAKDHGEGDLDIFNYVGESTNLSHQNVLHLINEAFESSGLDASQTAVVVISQDESLDHCLRDEILKFIGNESAQDRISIALCRGHLNEASGQIEGNTHWTALHLIRIQNKDGTISIKSYYMDSMGGDVPKAVTRVLDSIKETTLEDLSADLSANPIYQAAIERLDDADFSNCRILKRPTKQADGYSCGYHTVFNMIRMHNLKRVVSATGHGIVYEDHITQDEEEVAIEQFISSSKVNLQNHFNLAISGRFREHTKFSADMDLNRALSESILVSSDSELDKLKKLILLEKEIKNSEQEPAIVLSSLNLEKFYKKLLSQCVEQIRYKFLTSEKCEVGDEDDVEKREQILEKLSSAKTAQNPQEFLKILERMVADPTLLSSSLEGLLEEMGKIEKKQSAQDSLVSDMAKASLTDKPPSPSPDAAKAKQVAAGDKVAQKAAKK